MPLTLATRSDDLAVLHADHDVACLDHVVQGEAADLHGLHPVRCQLVDDQQAHATALVDQIQRPPLDLGSLADFWGRADHEDRPFHENQEAHEVRAVLEGQVAHEYQAIPANPRCLLDRDGPILAAGDIVQARNGQELVRPVGWATCVGDDQGVCSSASRLEHHWNLARVRPLVLRSVGGLMACRPSSAYPSKR